MAGGGPRQGTFPYTYVIWRADYEYHRETHEEDGNHGFSHLLQYIHEISENMFNKSCKTRFNTNILSHAFLVYNW